MELGAPFSGLVLSPNGELTVSPADRVREDLEMKWGGLDPVRVYVSVFPENGSKVGKHDRDGPVSTCGFPLLERFASPCVCSPGLLVSCLCFVFVFVFVFAWCASAVM